LVTSSDLAFREVSSWPAVCTAGGEPMRWISSALHRYKYHCRAACGHVRTRTGRDVDVAVSNGAMLGFTSNSYDFIYAV